MASFELIYDADDDVLEVTFATFDETFARTLPLNDNIVLYTDMSINAAWGLSLYRYSRLLQVSETHLDNLRELPDEAAQHILTVLRRPPLSAFITLLDTINFYAIIKSPSLRELF